MSRIRTFALLLALVAPALVRADLGPLEPVADLHRAVHESLGLPEPMIVRLLERGLPEPELPVAGYVARHAAVPVERVVDLRLGGLSWIDVALRVGPGPAIFYVPFDVDPGPPYGKAWGYYKKKPRSEWRTIRLTDAEIVHLANVRLVADHHHVTPGRVVELHRGGKGYATIHHELRTGKVAKVSKGGKPVAAASAGKGAKGSKGAKGAKDDSGNGNGAKKGKGKGPG
jgi:hypothetical protein